MSFNVRQFAKAIVGPLLGLLGALAQYAVTGHLDQHSLIYFGGGVLGGLVTYFVPNAQPEVQAVETAFNPPAAGHPDPVPAPVDAPAPAPPAPASAPATPPAA